MSFGRIQPFYNISNVKLSSAAVLAASSNQLGLHRSVQVSTLIKSSSAAVLAASSDRLVPHESVQVSILIKSSSAFGIGQEMLS